MRNIKRLSIPIKWLLSESFSYMNLGRDTTWSSKNEIQVFLRLKPVFILTMKAHLSNDSNNIPCPYVQYVSTTSPVSLAIWPSASTAKDNGSSSLE